MKLKTFSLFIVGALLLGGCANNSKTEKMIFDVTFKNYDGTVLYTTTAPYDGAAIYKGPTPTKPSDGYISYEFRGWDRDIEHIFKDTITFANYKEVYDKEDDYYTNGKFKYTRSSIGDGYEISTFYGYQTGQSNNGYLTLPSMYNDLPVLSIAAQVFQNESITKVKFGKHIKSIGDYAFAGCKKMTDIYFNDELEIIGKNAFKECLFLSQLTLPKSIKKIYDRAFCYAGVGSGSRSVSWTKVVIPLSIVYIGKEAFYSDVNGEERILSILCESSQVVEANFNNNWSVAGGFSDSIVIPPIYHKVSWDYHS